MTRDVAQALIPAGSRLGIPDVIVPYEVIEENR